MSLGVVQHFEMLLQMGMNVLELCFCIKWAICEQVDHSVALNDEVYFRPPKVFIRT